MGDGRVGEHALDVALRDPRRLPIAMESTDRMMSMSCHPLGNSGVSPESGRRAFTSSRIAIANAASLGPVR